MGMVIPARIQPLGIDSIQLVAALLLTVALFFLIRQKDPTPCLMAVYPRTTYPVLRPESTLRIRPSATSLASVRSMVTMLISGHSS